MQSRLRNSNPVGNESGDNSSAAIAPAALNQWGHGETRCEDSPIQHQAADEIQDFAHHVNEMLAQIADVLQPCDFDKYIAHAIDELQ